ncbi:MAG: hypothetical protein U9Q33_04165 [Campylobacterota bacterium]|nr:hypothetical protein [Campylobacterota bacterium]
MQWSLKQITDVSQEDIEIYVSQTYHMDINNVTYIDKTGLGQLKEKHHTIPLHLEKKYHPVKVQSSYKLFIIYLTSSFIIFLSILLYKHTLDEQAKNTNIKPQKETIQYNKLKKIYKQHNNKIVDHMTEIFKYIKLNNILLQELTYDNKFRIIVTHKQKINLLNLISTYNKKTNISSLIFDKQYNIYKMELEIEL